MARLMTLVACFVVLALIVTRGWRPAEPRSAPVGVDDSNLTVSEGIRFRNLTIFPVSSKTAANDDRFICLDEGLKNQTVRVLEAGAVNGANENGNSPAQIQQQSIVSGNDVNRLYVINDSDKPLYLMPGEIVFGGDQDRVVAEEYLIPSGGKPTPIAVFCVEHGRWGERSVNQTVMELTDASSSSHPVAGASADQLALREKAEQANRGEFIASVGNVTNKVRQAAVLGKDQSQVWNNVGQENMKSGVETDSSHFSRNYSDVEVVNRINEYQAAFDEEIAATPNVVGVVVAINGKVVSMDVFASTPLFKKLWPKMLKSFALEASNEANPGSVDSVCDLKQATTFLAESLSGTGTDDKQQLGLKVTKRESNTAVCLQYDLPEGLAPADGRQSAIDGVHASSFAK